MFLQVAIPYRAEAASLTLTNYANPVQAVGRGHQDTTLTIAAQEQRNPCAITTIYREQPTSFPAKHGLCQTAQAQITKQSATQTARDTNAK